MWSSAEWVKGGILPNNNFQQKSRIWENLTLGVFAASVNALMWNKTPMRQLNHGWHSTTMEPNAQIDLQFETFIFLLFNTEKGQIMPIFPRLFCW